MFTGLIEEIGLITGFNKQNNGAIITVSCKKILDGLKNGDSVAIDGACQTVTKISGSCFEVETSSETLNLTILNNYKKGQYVNLERAMAANGRFGGHIVSGHIEGVGEFLRREKQGLAWDYYFKAPEHIMKYIVYKGSVCINGISLTVALINENVFSVAVIPTTVEETNLKYLKSGNSIDLEPDILAKYVEKFVSKYDNSRSNITENYLLEHGFMD